MKPDDLVCYCFHVSKRKILNFLRVRRPRRASQLSECGGAGTGCGWCVRYLETCFRQQTETADSPSETEQDAETYAAGRAAYLQAGKGKAPRHAARPPASDMAVDPAPIPAPVTSTDTPSNTASNAPSGRASPLPEQLPEQLPGQPACREQNHSTE
jgi:bacterioferritin-associated ferredoxin